MSSAVRGTSAPVAIRGEVLPAWPFVWLVAGTPLWWATGLLPVIPVIFGVILAAHLLLHRNVRLPPGTLPFLAFAGWAAACIVMIDNPLRGSGFLIRWSAIATAALVVLYLANAPERLGVDLVLRCMAVLWGLVVLGGFLAVVWPNGGFVTPVGHLLPEGLRANELVDGLVAPSFAEVQQPFGAAEPFNRPSAPFPYANSWGAAYAYLTPMMIALRGRLARTPRRLLDLALAASIVPALATSNRGMLIILGAALLYVLARLAIRGDRRSLVTGLAVAGLAATAFVAAGGLEEIGARQEVSRSTEGRAAIYRATFEETAAFSPVMGFGAPRASEEIGVALGTQGAAWMYMFSYGFVGLALFLVALWGAVIRSALGIRKDHLWIHATLVGATVGIWFYGLDFLHLLTVAVATGLVLAQRARTP